MGKLLCASVHLDEDLGDIHTILGTIPLIPLANQADIACPPHFPNSFFKVRISMASPTPPHHATIP